jgi:hypothetical protein
MAKRDRWAIKKRSWPMTGCKPFRPAIYGIAGNRTIRMIKKGQLSCCRSLALLRLTGFCPSCGARRISQTAAHLVKHFIPHVPARQWVLFLPMLLRVMVAAQPALVMPVLRVVQRVATRHLLNASVFKDEGHCGVVAQGHRFGSP